MLRFKIAVHDSRLFSMALVRRFFVLQLLMLWQGGFLFYAAFVVPVGTEVLGSALEQGRITRFVSETINEIGVIALIIFALDLLHESPKSSLRKSWLWGSWTLMAVALLALFAVHQRLLELVDFVNSSIEDHPRFYFWHRVYLWIITIQWTAGLVYTILILSSWRNNDRGKHMISLKPEA